MHQPLLKTSRLILRDYQWEDWERVHIYGSDPVFSQYEVWGPNTVEDTKKFINSMIDQTLQVPRFQFDCAICIKESGLLIGGCGIRREAESSHVANMGWAISPEFQCKGFATEAAKALIQFGMEQLRLSVIYATCDVRNVASSKVMEKLGMKRVGLIKSERMQKGHLRDTLRYEIIEI